MFYFIRTYLIIGIFFCQFGANAQSKDSSKLFQKEDTLKNWMTYKVSSKLSYAYDKPSFWAYAKKTPRDFHQFFKQQTSLYGTTAMFLGTAAMVVIDQNLVDAAQKFGKSIGVDGRTNFVDISPIPKFPLQFPTDLPTSLYFIGDGITLGFVMSGFLTYGLIKKDNRALHTAYQIAEGLAIVTVFTQGLKHIAGRQTPFKRDQDPDLVPGGKWVWFPNQSDYAEHVPEYDAFPSGHEAAFMITLTVIAENYPEARWIKPIGYTLMGVLGFQMLNNGVHWASDYPISIAFSYMLGKFLVPKNHKVIENPELLGMRSLNWKEKIDLKPVLLFNNHTPVLGMGLSYQL